MPLKTGRFYESAEVNIDSEKCTVCGLCVKVCKGAPLYLDDDQIRIDQTRIFGCIGCGQCMAVCPQSAIEIRGRDMEPSRMIGLPPADKRATYDHLLMLMQSRRSIRNYMDKKVEQELIDKIIEAACFAPSGLAASDVEVTVFNGSEKVSELLHDIMAGLKRYKWLFSRPMLKIYRPFMSKDMYEVTSTFISGAVRIFLDGYENGEDWVFYRAPLAIYFHCSPYADPADTYIPATYAMLAAQSLGLGSCMIGTTSYFLNYFGKDIKKKYNIPLKNKSGIMLIAGYPDVKYAHAIKRSFAGVRQFD